MADIADIANDLAQSEIDSLIRNRVLPEPIVGSPVCLYCGTVLHETAQRWCDNNCRDDWQKQQRLQPHVDMRGVGMRVSSATASRISKLDYVSGGQPASMLGRS